MNLLEQLKKVEDQAAGTALGSLAGIVSSLHENRQAHDDQRLRAINGLREDLDSVVKLFDDQASQQPFLDIRAGILRGHYTVNNGLWTPSARPPLVTGNELTTGFNYPPKATQRDGQGNITSIGEMVLFGHRLDLPELRAALSGLQLYADREPTTEQLTLVYTAFNQLMGVLTQVVGPLNPQAPLLGPELNTIAAAIAAAPQGPQATRNFWMGLMSQASKAALAGIASVGTLTAPQTTLIVQYFNSLVSGIINAGGAPAVSAWIAASSPSLGDPALDAPWAYAYNGTTLLGAPTNTTAGTPGAVVVNTAVVASAAFGFITDNTEQQTVRRARLTFSNLSTAVAGQAVRMYLPRALAGNTPPKVSLSVEGNTWAQAGFPYVKNPTGGAIPYFDIWVVAGTNSASWNLIVDVSR